MSIKYVCTWREEAIKKEKRSHQKTKKINEEKYLRISRPYQKKRERRKESKWTKHGREETMSIRMKIQDKEIKHI